MFWMFRMFRTSQLSDYGRVWIPWMMLFSSWSSCSPSCGVRVGKVSFLLFPVQQVGLKGHIHARRSRTKPEHC